MKRVLLLGLVVFLFLVGCKGENDTVKVESVFDGGTQGIAARFEPFGIEESGVFTIFDTENFPIEVVLRNKGEEDMAPGDVHVSLRGINLGDFTGIASGEIVNKETIEKISEFNKEGEEEVIDFTPNEDAKYKHRVTGFFQPDIFAFVDYNYKTHVIIPKVCYKEDVRDESICELQEAKTFFVSGAPVTVKSVLQDIAGRGIIVLTLDVENVGGGKVTLRNADFDARYEQLAYSVETDTADWECRAGGRENEARLVGGKTTIICKLKAPLAEDTLFTKQVELTLTYKYRTIIQQTIKIKESTD